jgi:tetratricopeptide (TPR) repeat protein
MYLVFGDTSSILTWFHSQQKYGKFLCLLVAGHLHDTKFFQDVLEQRLALDTISGPNIAIFLFTNDPGEVVSMSIGPGSYKIVPGSLLVGKGFADYPGNLRDIRHINAQTSSMNANAIQEIINASQSMANQICTHFKLGREDIPCILVLSKGNAEPLVIPTRGEVDVQAFYSFLRDLRKIADVLPNNYDLNEPLALAESLVEQGQLAEAKAIYERADLQFQEAKNTCVKSLESFSVPSEQAQEFVKDGPSIRRAVGITYRYPLPTTNLPSHPGFQLAYEDAAFRDNCKELGKALQERKKALQRLEERKRQAKHFLKWSENMRSIEEAITQLCKKYENGFLWKARLRPLRAIVEKVVGGGKTVQDLISLEQTIKKLIEP